ncbi:hypothetical protein F7P75_01970 [Acinetobacter gandensis]|uniref:Uncharacterized protein n=1 Tax=Acinetobacter gandensis TaxID=1443941 RepID=A0A1A7RAZ8_9GAMM|nr:hypothetical protein [Acinetobacter gandensis]KAB0629149.1 hypothetical protein F7P75_01970 [Acinetobacter gandensis]OBX29101.1 hypothetical protein A9J31_02065 [Acinetobacter gandensis]
MDKLFAAAALFGLLLWVWAEFFRAIPNLEQVGVLKNFQLTTKEEIQGRFTVLDKRYYSAGHRLLHPAAPTVVGGFQDLAYVSNIDLLLSQNQQSYQTLKQQFEWTQDSRCFELKAKSSTSAPLAQTSEQLFNMSVIASTEAVANQIRRLKAGQQVQLQAEWVDVHSIKTGRAFNIAAARHGQHCRIYKINAMQIL